MSELFVNTDMITTAKIGIYPYLYGWYEFTIDVISLNMTKYLKLKSGLSYTKHVHK